MEFKNLVFYSFNSDVNKLPSVKFVKKAIAERKIIKDFDMSGMEIEESRWFSRAGFPKVNDEPTIITKVILLKEDLKNMDDKGYNVMIVKKVQQSESKPIGLDVVESKDGLDIEILWGGMMPACFEASMLVTWYNGEEDEMDYICLNLRHPNAVLIEEFRWLLTDEDKSIFM